MTTFFIPLGGGSRWDNQEIKYLLRSLEKNYTEDYNVVVYADTDTEVDLKNVTVKWIDRFYPDWLLKKNKGSRKYENYFCVLNKVHQFTLSEDCPDSFVYIYDDVLLNKPIGRADILNIGECVYKDQMELSYRRSRHGMTVLKALQLSKSKVRYEHHLPLIYSRDILKEMFDGYPFWELDIPYSLATTYFNLYFPSTKTIQEVPNYKAGLEGFANAVCCYDQDTVKDVRKAVKDKTWINYNDTGLFWMPQDYPLQKWIKEEFNEKSKFEK